jgi:hypothetical protein
MKADGSKLTTVVASDIEGLLERVHEESRLGNALSSAGGRLFCLLHAKYTDELPETAGSALVSSASTPPALRTRVAGAGQAALKSGWRPLAPRGHRACASGE